MNAILGPTGSGKSSLLDILAGRKNPSGLSGQLLMNGLPPPENFKCRMGYVVQDDVVMGTLTVKENLAFSAVCRLPRSVSNEERAERVQLLVHELGLDSCADTRVGNEFVPGVSGGERKRCNIGMELVIQPSILFLDEPTTGLDACTAKSVMMLLQRMANQGQTLVFSIHQPRYSIYRLFDSVILLSMGETVYHGPASSVLDFFEQNGYKCEIHNNPPDFFLDVISGDTTPVHSDMFGHKDLTSQPQILVSAFKTSSHYSRLMDELKSIKEDFERKMLNGSLVLMPKVKYTTSFCTQFTVVSVRTIRNLVRNPEASIAQVVIMSIFAVLVGTVYYQVSDCMLDGLQNRVGAFFFIVMNQVFGNLSAVELFIKERALFMHENVSGFYSVSAFFVAKVLCDTVPMRIIPNIIFCGISYYMIGLRSSFGRFLFFFLNMCLTSLSASGLAILVSATVRTFSVANLLIALLYVFMMLFSGLLVNLQTIVDWLRWMRFLSILRYSLNALYINEMKDQRYCNANFTSCHYGNDYLTSQDIPHSDTWHMWINEVALVVFITIFFLLSYVQLCRLNKMH